jgi:SAM-dependent methyltransferase
MTTGPPPESAADALARLYDVDLLEDPGDVDLYLALAARTDGPILELGVGSGRVAVPLAEAGYAVTGLDLDPAMLRRARERAARAGRVVERRLTLVEGDARHLPASVGAFHLAFIALNSLLVFGERRDQERAIASIADHLEPGGLAVIDVWLPAADDLARYDGRLCLESVRRDPETGFTVAKMASADHDTATGMVELTVLFDEGPAGEPPRRWVRKDRLRLVGPDDLRGFAERAGLEVETIAGSYDLDAIRAGDDRAILVARKPRPAGTGTANRRASGTSRTGSGGRSALVS